MINNKGQIQIFKWKVNVVVILVVLIVLSVVWGITFQISNLTTKFKTQVSERQIRAKILSEQKDEYQKKLDELEIWKQGYKEGYKAKEKNK